MFVTGRIPVFAGRYVAVLAALGASFLAACSFSGKPTPATPATNDARSASQPSEARAARQHLYVANVSTITVYGLDSPSVVRTISGVTPTSIAFDSLGKLYVANAVGAQQGTVAVYDKEASSPRYQITTGIRFPNSLVLNAARDLFVSNYYGTDYAYAPGKTTALYSMSNLFSVALALDTKGRLYVAQNQGPYGGGGGRVQIHEQSTGKLLYTIKGTIQEPEAIALDASNNLYVANDGNVTVYGAGGTNLIRTLKGSLKAPHALAFDKSGKLYVADDAASTVTVYAPGRTKVVKTITKGLLRPAALAFDSAGNLYVANQSSVTEYAPSTLALERTFTQGVKRPMTLAVGP